MSDKITRRERPVLGRTIGKEQLAAVSAVGGDDKVQRFTLASGRRVSFITEIIPAEALKSRTFVDEQINGREQSSLTRQSLESIIRSLPEQQFFPAIGRLVGDKIEILDGSRRRAAALFCNADLRVIYTKSEITIDDARKLAVDIQTAKEHTIREVGLRYLAMRNEGMQQKDIAEKEGVSTAKVTRAIHAASVPEVMLLPFPDRSELSYADYRKLMTISDAAGQKDIDLEELSQNVMEQSAPLEQSETVLSVELKDEIIKLFESIVAGNKANKKKPAADVVALKNFEDKRIYARQKTYAKDRKVVYELCRLPSDVQKEIEDAIKNILSKHE